jgi:hypothetical protein
VPLFLSLPRLGDAAVTWWWWVRGRQLPRNLGT